MYFFFVAIKCSAKCVGHVNVDTEMMTFASSASYYGFLPGYL